MLIWSKPEFKLHQYPVEYPGLGHSFSMDINLYFCGKCCYAWLFPVPDAQVMDRFYREEYDSYYISPLTSHGLTQQINNDACDFIARTVTDMFLGSAVRLADVGGYDGYALERLSHIARERLLIEGSKTGAAIAKKYGIPVLESFLDAAVAHELSGKFDVVICREVIEHVAEPVVFIKNLSRLLDKGGLLFIETPDLAAILDRALVRSIMLQHFHVFSLKSMANILEQCGLGVVCQDFPSDISFIVGAAKNPPPADKIKKFFSRAIDHVKVVQANAQSFTSRAHLKNDKLRSLIEKWVKESKRIWIWGAGSAGGEIFSVYGQEAKHFCGYIDSDKNRQGKRFANAPDLQILPPELAYNSGIDAVLIASFSVKEIVETIKKLAWNVAVADIYNCQEL